MRESLVLLLLIPRFIQGAGMPEQRTDRPPVLTVCEALCRALEYEGRHVYIVGRVRFTFEGGWLSQEQCPCTLMWGGQELGSSISLRYVPGHGQRGDYDLIRPLALEKLKEVNQTTQFEEDDCAAVVFGEFRSIYGETYQTALDKRLKERLQKGELGRIRPGFGHLNGSPAGLFGTCDVSSLTPGVEIRRLE